MERKEIINEIALILEQWNIRAYVNIDLPMIVTELDIWVNDSGDCDGEDLQVYAIGYENNVFGVFVGNSDFFPFDELTDNEIERIYESL
jgi:hypothetical protein